MKQIIIYLSSLSALILGLLGYPWAFNLFIFYSIVVILFVSLSLAIWGFVACLLFFCDIFDSKSNQLSKYLNDTVKSLKEAKYGRGVLYVNMVHNVVVPILLASTGHWFLASIWTIVLGFGLVVLFIKNNKVLNSNKLDENV